MIPGGSVTQATSLPLTSAPVAGATDSAPQSTSAAPTDVAVSGDAISCNGIDQARSFFDCTVSNTDNTPAEFGVMITPLGSDVQGFFYGVTVDGQTIQPTPGEESGETIFNIGSISTGDSKPVRVTLSCVSASGCSTTAFTLSLINPQSQESFGEVRVMSPP
jgi:hypothetical protein